MGLPTLSSRSWQAHRQIDPNDWTDVLAYNLMIAAMLGVHSWLYTDPNFFH